MTQEKQEESEQPKYIIKKVVVYRDLDTGQFVKRSIVGE